MDKLSINDLALSGKKALIRVDFNVPLENGTIIDDSKIAATIPTIKYALSHGASVILLSHLGRPKGKPDPSLSLAPCASKLSQLLKIPVKLAPDSVGLEVDQLAKKLRPGEILLLENLRFHVGEENPEKEPSFVNALASLGDVYINDAFATSHRAHASTTFIADFFPGKAAAGLLLEKEITYLSTHLDNPKRPFFAILGGAKVSTKFKLIETLLKKVDVLIIGGAMSYTFFKAEKIPIGNSLFEPEFISSAREILDITSKIKCRVILPVDSVISQDIQSGQSKIVNMHDGIPDGWSGVDIGPETIKMIEKELKQAATVFWNGPMGIFEKPPFDAGTNAIASTLSNLKSAITIVGGGDSVAAVHAAGVADKISHLSTGGGASLEYIELGHLPGIDALSERPKSHQ